MTGNKKETILIIDDDTRLLAALQHVIKFEGYEVETANSAIKGLDILKTTRVDLIILDIKMPGMSGLGFLREISSTEGRPMFPVLVLTGRPNMADFFANLDVEAFIEKPCPADQLLAEIRRILTLRDLHTDEAGKKKSVAKSLGPKKVLLAEDDSEVEEQLRRAIADAGFKVEIVRDGAEVIERVILFKPAVIVMNRILVGMNGDRLSAVLREMPKTSDIPVVLYEEKGTAESASRLRGKANIHKYLRTNNSQTLVDAVKSACN